MVRHTLKILHDFKLSVIVWGCYALLSNTKLHKDQLQQRLKERANYWTRKVEVVFVRPFWALNHCV